MHLKSVVHRVQHLKRQHHPMNYTFVWQDQNGRYRVNEETRDETAYQRWREQQEPNTAVYIFAWL